MVFVETRIEAFVPQIKTYAELGVEKVLKDRVRISIGNIEGGIIKPIIFNDIRISDKKGSLLLSSVDINSIRTDYRIWNIFLSYLGGNGKKGSEEFYISRDTPVYINFVTRDSRAAGFLKLEGGVTSSSVKGYVNVRGKGKVDFSGSINEDSFKADISSAFGDIVVTGNLEDNGAVNATARLEHVRVCGFDIVCNLRLRNRIAGADKGPGKAYLEGELETENLILNYKPFFNIKALYRVSNGILEVSDFSIGDLVRGRTKIMMARPYNTDAAFTVNNLNLGWLFYNLGVKDGTSIMSGTMSGRFEFKGKAENLRSNISMEIRKGTIAKCDFDSLSAVLRGEGPIVRIEESRINRESGFFVLAGEMDMRKIGKSNMFSDIKLTSDDRAISWDGWQTTKLQNAQEIRMEKKLNEEISLDFKKFISDVNADESLRYTDEVQLEYKLHPKDSLTMTMGQDKDFFGLEHKEKF
jgi:hypothetical protein